MKEIISVVIPWLPESLTKKKVLVDFFTNTECIGDIQNIVIMKKGAKMKIKMCDNSIYKCLINNKIYKIYLDDKSYIILKRVKSINEKKLEKKIKVLKKELEKIKRQEGLQCGSCKNTEELYLDDEETGLYYCKHCWYMYNTEQWLISQNNI
tara:strand:+ start:12317 stop:12772 length:456 start_codon:yes stop_codon:yes gene_type:complete